MIGFLLCLGKESWHICLSNNRQFISGCEATDNLPRSLSYSPHIGGTAYSLLKLKQSQKLAFRPLLSVFIVFSVCIFISKIALVKEIVRLKMFLKHFSCVFRCPKGHAIILDFYSAGVWRFLLARAAGPRALCDVCPSFPFPGVEWPRKQ